MIQRCLANDRAFVRKKYRLSAEAAYAYRQTHAPPIMKEIQSLMNESSHRVPPNSVLGKALTYLQNQWPKLQVYLEDGRLEISNNQLERAIKPFATGRRNWLFANSEPGAHAAANILSLIETCKANDVNLYDGYAMHWKGYRLVSVLKTMRRCCRFTFIRASNSTS